MVVMTVALWFFSRPGGDRKWKLACGSGFAAAALAYAVAFAIHHAWARPRPYETHHISHPWSNTTDASFPSDHASVSYAIAFAVLAFPPVAAEAEHILGRHDRQSGAGGVGELDQPPLRLAWIEAGGSPVPRTEGREPAGGGVRVVRARVGDRVAAMVLERVRVAARAAEGPEEHDHPREAELVAQAQDRWRDVAEVLGDQGQGTELALDGPEELGAGTGPPVPPPGGRVPRGDGPVGDEAAEVV